MRLQNYKNFNFAQPLKMTNFAENKICFAYAKQIKRRYQYYRLYNYMNIREICNGVHYVGVNDRTTSLFEGLWPLPYGVTYNSYIVKGDKTALIETVEIGHVEDYIRHIESITEGKAPDYVILDHMEPDHSGGLPVVLDRYPEMKIIGNRQTIGMVKGFYHIEDDSRFIEVADGTTIELGGKTLKFYLTPMVHWPETMMTYLVEDELLFSGDAFGCFGALNGGILDGELDLKIYKEETYRYYSNIVGKYGKFVQRALAKTKDLKINYICPTHGPIWHDEISFIVDIYDRLSRYEGEEGVVIIYGSMYGNTAEVAEEIGRHLAERGVKNIKIHNASKSNMSDMISDAFRYKGLIVGSATYSMHIFPPVEQFMIGMETREVKNKVFAAFGSFTWASAALPQILDYGKKIGLEAVSSFTVKQSSNEETMNQIAELADKFAAALGE